ncbi:MAG TPA: hypothetical protein VFE92_08495 [Dermatophilaceae bacterium]|nr:hypothetical protein [Dermatophilaceae bacterium]
MVINPRSAVGMAAIWLVAVAGVSATAWLAIDRAGRDITTASVSTLSAPLNTPTRDSEPRSTATPTPTPSATPTPTPDAFPTATPDAFPSPSVAPAPATPRPAASPTPTITARRAPPAPTPQDKTISVTGGLVSARCTGATIALRIAQPQNDWRVQVDASGGQQIAVSFQTGEDDSARNTQVTAVCQNGAPTFTVTNG